MTDNQKNIIGTILLNMSASSLPVTEEMISNLVDMNDNMNTMMYGTPQMTPEEREEVINTLHAGSRGQNECHLSVSVLGNISTTFLALSVGGNISTFNYHTIKCV